MAQENHHLTTEQFSAHLDGQLSDMEQSQLDSHLKTCEQCQQELTDLRRTVALLHALPRPALPRSFVLPLDIQSSTGDQREDKEEVEDEADHAPIALATARARRSVTDTEKPARRRWPTYVRTALRTVSSIAAVIGLVLFLSGVLATLPHGGGAATMSTGSSASSPSQGSGTTQDARVAASNNTNNKGVEPQISPSSRATIPSQEPTPAARATATLESAAGTQATASPPQSAYSTASTPSRSQVPTILFFDLSSGPGRLGFGFLLLLLGVMGYVVFKRRWRQEQA